jgi:hypothetical protein
LPTELNVSQWIESMLAVGVKHSVITAKHGCGFCLWPSDAVMADGSRYNYSTAFGLLPPAEQDILRQYVDASAAAGLGHGFYYSLVDHGGNYFLHNLRVNRSEFVSIERQHEQELWARYGNLTEIWFDGGYRSDEQPWLASMLATLQPGAAIHGGNEGGGGRITDNPVAGCGSESQVVNEPIWSAGEGLPGNHSGVGSRDGAKFAPKSLDWTIQSDDYWFWNPYKPPVALVRLIEMYHGTVGSNGVLELSWSPDRRGLIPDDHVARYTELGTWIRGCYGQPIAEATSGWQSARVASVALPEGAHFDRVMLQEEISKGQRVWSYSLEARLHSGGPWLLMHNGTSIGNKKIVLNAPALPPIAAPPLPAAAAAAAAPPGPPQARVFIAQPKHFCESAMQRVLFRGNVSLEVCKAKCEAAAECWCYDYSAQPPHRQSSCRVGADRNAATQPSGAGYTAYTCTNCKPVPPPPPPPPPAPPPPPPTPPRVYVAGAGCEVRLTVHEERDVPIIKRVAVFAPCSAD